MEIICFTFYESLLKHPGGLNTKQLLLYLEMNKQNSNGLRHDQPKKHHTLFWNILEGEDRINNGPAVIFICSVVKIGTTKWRVLNTSEY